ncbi:TPA: NADP-dependent malic enzyme [Candidatus Saccharibacteria bacterium]|nr:NADP-dependent malic enzyme [Candidatus Saccharibacteria bacterium]HIO87772.1 NADP-dependent malic enzyme [Candidatus Saccharibacteria bacterium]
MDDVKQQALDIHKKFKGKLETGLKDPVDSMEKLSLYYTPGVGAVSSYVAEHPEEARNYTQINNTVAVVSDGSAVLGLGNIGPLGALPVMEGKAVLFKSFANVDAVPIVLNTQDPDEIINIVKAIAPTYGGINLEDIKAPQCFYIEETLKQELDIPVFHDDQHGTAIVVLAGLINACKLTNRDLNDSWITVSGVGAAGVAIIKLIKQYAPKANILAVDSKGIIWSGRDDLNETKLSLIKQDLIFAEDGGDLAKAMTEADIFIGVSLGGLLKKEMVATMNKDAIIFAMANPVPEIYPDEAKQAGAAVVATGRSDFDNQVNNALVFPALFRGALDNNVKAITEEHKMAAAKALAGLIENPTPDKIIPDIFDKRILEAVSSVVK